MKIHLSLADPFTSTCKRARVVPTRNLLVFELGDRCKRCNATFVAVKQLIQHVHDAGWCTLIGSSKRLADQLVTLGYFSSHPGSGSGPAFELSNKGRHFVAQSAVNASAKGG